MSHAHKAVAVPIHETWEGRLRNGSMVRARPIRHEDGELERDFLARLSQEAAEHCFLGVIRPDRAAVAKELTEPDERREFAILALTRQHGKDVVIGTARYRADESGKHCDCAAAVDPAWRQQGVGSILMNHLIGVARVRGIRRMYAVDAARCAGAHALAGYLGFHSSPDPEDPASVTFELILE